MNPDVITCPKCNGPAVLLGSDTAETLVGFDSPPGHDHDDNCMTRSVWCASGHRWGISLRRSCQACDWRGKPACWCHKGAKVDAWPDLPTKPYITGYSDNGVAPKENP